MFVCDQCQKECGVNAKFCSECGGKVVEIIEKTSIYVDKQSTSVEDVEVSSAYVCKKCHKKYDTATDFCSECGGKVNKTPKEEKLTPAYACRKCKKTYDASVKFCKKCGGMVRLHNVYNIALTEAIFEYIILPILVMGCFGGLAGVGVRCILYFLYWICFIAFAIICLLLALLVGADYRSVGKGCHVPSWEDLGNWETWLVFGIILGCLG